MLGTQPSSWPMQLQLTYQEIKWAKDDQQAGKS